jgi:hypothetical protein
LTLRETTMPITIEGTYHEGRVELKEKPPVEAGSRVIVTFIDAGETVTEEARRRLSDRALRRMEDGLDLGGPPYPSREELHDRARR